jgi:hypothetical protein
MDHWVFPVGTRLWKEFSKNGVLLETRLIERTGATSYRIVPFVWRPDSSDAVLVTSGQSNVNGTQHDVPSTRDCLTCHEGDTGRVLGFSAIQLSKPGTGITLNWLASNNWLSHPPPAGVDYPVPGDLIQSNALGYLHGNCAHCHNPQGECSRANMTLRLSVSERTVQQTQTYAATINVQGRIIPGDPSRSEVYQNMNTRGWQQMPPLGTEVTDPEGLQKIRDWIMSLAQ